MTDVSHVSPTTNIRRFAAAVYAGSCCKEDAAASALVVAARPASEAAVDGCCQGVALLVIGLVLAAPVVTALVRGSGPGLLGNDKLLVDDLGS